jgi:hypothetical protein
LKIRSHPLPKKIHRDASNENKASFEQKQQVPICSPAASADLFGEPYYGFDGYQFRFFGGKT